MSRRAAVLRALAVALVLGAAAAPPAAAQEAATARRAGLAGVITDFWDRRLVGATIVVESDSGGTISDRRGEFRLRTLPAGRRRFLVRRVGYEPALFELDLRRDSIVSVHVRLRESLVSLGTVVVEGTSHSLPLFREGFYERAARQASGWFFPPEEIMRRRITTVAALLNEVPGVMLERRNASVVAFSRAVGKAPCPYNVWIDGALAGAAAANLDELAPGPIVRAVEIYPTAASTPARFVRNNNLCGTLVVWTKGVVRELF